MRERGVCEGGGGGVNVEVNRYCHVYSCCFLMHVRALPA